MLDLKNCIATSVVLSTAMYVKPGLKAAKNAGKKYFSNRFPLEHELKASAAKDGAYEYAGKADLNKPILTIEIQKENWGLPRIFH